MDGFNHTSEIRVAESSQGVDFVEKAKFGNSSSGTNVSETKVTDLSKPKYERRLVQNVGIEFSHTTVECRFLLKFFRSSNSETDFSKYIKIIKDWQSESRGSEPLHLGFMELDLFPNTHFI